MYPTAAKLVAGLIFAALAFFISGLVIPNIPFGENTPVSFGLINAAIGFVLGWRVCGRRAGEGYGFAAAYAITAVVAIVFWALLWWAGREMIERSLDLYYDDPIEALEETVRLMVEYSGYLLGNNVLPALAAGALFCGVVVEGVGQKSARPQE